MTVHFSLRTLAFWAGLLVLLGIPGSAARAHGGGGGDLGHHWAWQDLPLLLLIGGVYCRGLLALWGRAGRGKGITPARAGAFGLGWLILFAALVSPLDFLSDKLFSAHMVQHLLLVLAAAPLFVLGRFTLALQWALPPRWTSRIWNQWRWKDAWRFLRRPAAACLLHGAVIWFWHMPRPYQAALDNEWIHFLEHSTFFLSAFLFWQVFAELTDNLRPGAAEKVGLGVLYIFVIMMVSGLLGVLIAFSPYVWFPAHIPETRYYGLTPLEDQHLAGTLMWVPAGVVYLIAAMGVLGRWLYAMEAAETPPIWKENRRSL